MKFDATSFSSEQHVAPLSHGPNASSDCRTKPRRLSRREIRSPAAKPVTLSFIAAAPMIEVMTFIFSGSHYTGVIK